MSLIVLVLLALAGCTAASPAGGGSSSSGGSTTGSSSSSSSSSGGVECGDGGRLDPYQDGGSCSASLPAGPANVAQRITIRQTTAAPPIAPAGGGPTDGGQLFADGTYVLTDWTFYGRGEDKTLGTEQMTARVSGLYVDAVGDSNCAGPLAIRMAAVGGTLCASLPGHAACGPTELVTRFQCGALVGDDFGANGYSLTDAGFVLFTDGTDVRTFVRQ